MHPESPDAVELWQEFRTDRETNKRPMAREKVHPELQDGMSAYGSLEAAREIWNEVCKPNAEARGEPVRAGYFIAQVNLRPGNGFAIEDLGEVDEHVTIWGDPHALAGVVSEIYPASTEED